MNNPTAFPQLVDFRPVDYYGPIRNTNTIAARTLANPDLVTSQILWSASMVSQADGFSIDLPVYQVDDPPESWQLAVSFQNSKGDTIRYLLIPPLTGAILFSTYEGQTLQAPATVEIWSVPGQASAVIAEDIVLRLNTYYRPETYTVINTLGALTPDNTNL